MRLVSVEGRNFRSYKTLAWAVPSIGLFLIDGENLDTGRNNMTGKTTLVDSIFWALYGYLPKWGGTKGGPVDAVIKRGETKCQVQVVIENEGKRIFVRRERPNKLHVEVDGVVVPGKSDELNDRIVELIGMTAEQFLTSVYISQDRKQSFFTMGESDRTLLLSQVSKVENINKGLEKAKKSKTDLELQIEKQKSFIEALDLQALKLPEIVENAKKEHDGLVIRLEQLSSFYIARQVQVEDAKKASLANSEYLINQKVQEFEAERDRLLGILQESEAKHTLLESTGMTIPKVEVQYSQRIEELKLQIAQAESQNFAHAKANADLSIARAGLSNSLNEMESAQNGKCDHCNQDLPQSMRDEHVQQMLGHAKRWEEKIVGIVVPEKLDVEPLKAQLNEALSSYAQRKASLEAEPKRITSEVQVSKMQLDLMRKNLMALSENHTRDIKDIQNQLSFAIANLEKQLDTEKRAIDMQEQQIASSLKQVAQAESQVAALQAEIDQNKVKLSSLNLQLDEALDLIDVFKGFRQVCFEDLIARISDRAGNLLSLMTDGIYTTRIDQMGETSKGEAKLILKPMITKGGQDVPLDDLSGGARRTVMLAYDVAVAEAVGDCNALFLDEALDGLDYMGKSEAMRLLEEVSKNKAVLVIDHSSEIKAAFSEVIKVTYRDGTSSLEGSDVSSITDPGSASA